MNILVSKVNGNDFNNLLLMLPKKICPNIEYCTFFKNAGCFQKNISMAFIEEYILISIKKFLTEIFTTCSISIV